MNTILFSILAGVGAGSFVTIMIILFVVARGTKGNELMRRQHSDIHEENIAQFMRRNELLEHQNDILTQILHTLRK